MLHKGYESLIYIILSLYYLNLFKSSVLVTSGPGAPPEDGTFKAHEHLSASGDRSDAEGHSAGPEHPGGPQASHRRDHHHEREPARRPGLHV